MLGKQILAINLRSVDWYERVAMPQTCGVSTVYIAVLGWVWQAVGGTRQQGSVDQDGSSGEAAAEQSRHSVLHTPSGYK